MRITESMMSQQLLYNLNQIQEGIATSQNEMATGKLLNKPSDNPLAVSQVMADSTSISQAQSYLSNIQSGSTWMSSTSTVLQSMTSTLQSIRNIALQALNTPSQTANATTGLQQEVAQLINNVYQLTDTQQGNSYLFGGFASETQVSTYIAPSQLTTNATAASTTAPVVTTGGTVSIIGSLGSAQVTIPNNATLQQIQTAINGVQSQTGVTASLPAGGAGVQLVLQPQQPGTAFGMSGNQVTLTGGSALSVSSVQTNTPPAGYTGSIQYAVSSSTKEQVNVTADSVFNQTPPKATQGLANTLQSILNDIGNPSGLQQDLGNLSANISQMIQINTEVGARQNQMQTMQTQTNQFITNLKNQQGTLQNANMAQVLTQYNSDMTTFQAALQMGAKVLLPTLAQYLP
ncbi:flagellar hook-associated protein FlgL [Alicyclobacillus curvatus]|nr:flagellar hook-associated protein FlgL [Alicyclobacillus curvatus]